MNKSQHADIPNNLAYLETRLKRLMGDDRFVVVPYTRTKIGFGLSGGPAWFLASKGSVGDMDTLQDDLDEIVFFLNQLPHLIDEVRRHRGRSYLLATILEYIADGEDVDLSAITVELTHQQSSLGQVTADTLIEQAKKTYAEAVSMPAEVH